ncbi:MAG: DUF4250 domain-containing protein [Clostridium sp.]|nr:DUF4250 domain-containing protein [Clostridium sp.]
MTNETLNSMDPYILLSVINTKLRDEYSSLDILCEDLDLEKSKIIDKLESVDYKYNSEENQFK